MPTIRFIRAFADRDTAMMSIACSESVRICLRINLLVGYRTRFIPNSRLVFMRIGRGSYMLIKMIMLFYRPHGIIQPAYYILVEYGVTGLDGFFRCCLQLSSLDLCLFFFSASLIHSQNP